MEPPSDPVRFRSRRSSPFRQTPRHATRADEQEWASIVPPWQEAASSSTRTLPRRSRPRTVELGARREVEHRDDNGGVPKITAPTVAEHRVAQRGALIAAAEALIAEGGMAAITPRSVGERAGLARSSFYEYFPSKDDLLAAIAMRAFDEWAAELEAAMAAAAPGRARLHAYVEATIRMTSDGKHTLATGLQQADLSPKSLEAIMGMHDALTTPLRHLLADLRIPNAASQAVLVQGVINAGMQLVGHGMDADDVIVAVHTILDQGVRG